MSVTLFHVSDLHFGAADHAALDWFAAEVARERPDAVICTGDLTMRGTQREFDAAADYLAALPVPVSIEPGNHDMPYYWEMLTRLRMPFARFAAMRARAHRDLPLAEVALVSLPTVAPAQWRLNWSKGCVKAPALTAALRQLGAAEGAGLKLVACHHPLVDADTDGSGSTRGGRRALAALVTSIAATAPRTPNWMARSEMSSEPLPAPAAKCWCWKPPKPSARKPPAATAKSSTPASTIPRQASRRGSASKAARGFTTSASRMASRTPAAAS